MTTEIRSREGSISIALPSGGRVVTIPLSDGGVKEVLLLSFRDRRHRKPIVGELLEDNPVAFHGWGVSGVCGRVDRESRFTKFWEVKQGRPPGSKIPLLEPPRLAVQHVDWQAVHPDFAYLQDPGKLQKLWSRRLPFHLIFPYNASARSLSEAVVTPPFDPVVAPNIPVPTICLFWVKDPAMVNMVKDVKSRNLAVQLGVSSLNEAHELPTFNTRDLIDYLKDRQIAKYDIVVEDPLLEPLDIASSHSQLVVPLRGQEPIWLMKRRGSLSVRAFHELTGFYVVEVANVPVASRKANPDENLDHKLYELSRRIGFWYLKALLHLV